MVEKKIERLAFADQELSDVTLEIGAMQYGIALDAIIGLDILLALEAVIDLSAMELRFAGNQTVELIGNP